MTQQANTDVSDIEANHRKDISFTEFKNLKSSLYHIEHEISTVYSDLCTWKAPQTRIPPGASEEHAAAMETEHTTLTQSPEPNQDGDTEGITKGEETVIRAKQDFQQSTSRSRARAETRRIAIASRNDHRQE